MLNPTSAPLRPRVLLVDDELTKLDTALGRAAESLAKALEARNIEVIRALSFEDGQATVSSDSSLRAVLLDWNLGRNDEGTHAQATALLHKLRERHDDVPVFLLADRERTRGTMTVEVAEMVDEFVWMLEDTADFVGGPRAGGDPSLSKRSSCRPTRAALAEYAEAARVFVGSARPPGRHRIHQASGRARFLRLLRRKPVSHRHGDRARRAWLAARPHRTGRREREVRGPRVRRAPQLLGRRRHLRVEPQHHAGLHEGGRLGGPRPQLPQVDRAGPDAHRARDQSTWCRRAIATASSARLRPPRWIRRRSAQRHKRAPLTKKIADQKPVYAVVTNCTYDGLCYDAVRVAGAAREILRPHPFRRSLVRLRALQSDVPDHFAMRGDPAAHDGPTVFATHSTHKLLAALSQASYIHMRDGKGAIDHHRFNEAYMMHTTTSPLYAIIASNDIAAAMMDGSSGRSLTQEVIEEAVDFRQVVGRLWRTFADKKDWFFKPWNVETVKNTTTAADVAFEDAPANYSATIRTPGCYTPATNGTASTTSPKAGACSIRSR